jgi:transcriptional regulator with XRE-family HTH domain
MSVCNRDILISNIKNLMKNNNMTQQELAEVLDMSQPNISKALSVSDTKSFTLDQVVGIANHFNVTVDWLLGNETKSTQTLSPRTIGQFIVELIENEEIETFSHSVTETIYEPDYDIYGSNRNSDGAEKEIVYNAFYFPSYWYIPDGLPYDEQCSLFSEMTQCGNDKIHLQTNKFINHFLQIHKMYKQNSLEEETYKTIVKDLLNHLSDKELRSIRT